MATPQLSRRDFLKISAGATLGLALGACAPSAPPAPTQAPTSVPQEEVLIRIMDSQGGQLNYTEAYDEIFALYKQAHPNVKFERRALGYDEFNTAIQPVLASGDLADLQGATSAEQAFQMAKAGLLVPLSDELDRDPGWKARLGKVATVDPSFRGPDGKQYMFPFDVYIATMPYYKDILAAENLQPWTSVDEFLSVARPLKDKGLYVAFADGTAFYYVKETFMVMVAQQTGGDIGQVTQAEMGQASWQNDVSLNAIRAIQAAMEPRPPEFFSLDGGTLQTMFYEKQAWAQWYGGPWLAGEYEKNIPEDVQNDNIGIANFPKPTADSNANIWMGGPAQSYGIAANSSHRDVALDFLKFLSTPEVVQVLLRHAIFAAGHVDDPGKYTDSRALKIFLETFAQADGLVVPYTVSGDVMTRFADNTGRMLQGQLTPEAFLEDMDAAFYKG